MLVSVCVELGLVVEGSHLSLHDLGELATNGVISEHNAASISTAPRKKKRKSLATTVVESQSVALATVRTDSIRAHYSHS